MFDDLKDALKKEKEELSIVHSIYDRLDHALIIDSCICEYERAFRLSREDWESFSADRFGIFAWFCKKLNEYENKFNDIVSKNKKERTKMMKKLTRSLRIFVGEGKKSNFCCYISHLGVPILKEFVFWDVGKESFNFQVFDIKEGERIEKSTATTTSSSLLLSSSSSLIPSFDTSLQKIEEQKEDSKVMKKE